MSNRESSTRGAWIGGLVGFNLWVLCLGVWSLIAGELTVMFPIVLITLAATLALSLECIAFAEIRARLGPTWSDVTSILLQAAVWTSLGVVGLLCRYWIVPAASEAAGMRELFRQFSTPMDYPLFVAVGPLLAGLILWSVGVARIMRTSTHYGESFARSPGIEGH